jgi:hypothetical protein
VHVGCHEDETSLTIDEVPILFSRKDKSTPFSFLAKISRQCDIVQINMYSMRDLVFFLNKTMRDLVGFSFSA